MVFPPGVRLNDHSLQWKLIQLPHLKHHSFIHSQSAWMCETMLERRESNWSSLPAAHLLHGRADVVHSGSQFVLDCSHYGERRPLSVPVITFIYRPPGHTRFIFTLVWMKPVAGSYTAPGTTSTSTSSCPSSCEPWPCWPKMTSSSTERRSALTSHHWWAHHLGWCHHTFLQIKLGRSAACFSVWC